MNNFPKIKNLTWLNDFYPDLVSIKITLELNDKLGIFPTKELESLQYLDMTQLCGIRRWYAQGEDEPSTTECIADINGIESLVLNIPKEELIKAWLFLKNYERITNLL